MDLSDAGQQAVRRLAAALQGKKWPDAVLDDALAILVLSSAPLDALDPIEEAILASFSARIGMAPRADGKELGKRIGEYFAKNPLPDELMTEMTGALREMLSTNNAEKAAAALGASESKVPVAQREGAAGSSKMGVMGRFAFDKKK